MIDSHIHLDSDQYYDRVGLIKRARMAGVRAVVVPGVDPLSNWRVLELARHFRGVVYPAIGFHPERFELDDSAFENTLRTIEQARDSICAVGEVGLPFYGDQSKAPGVYEKARIGL